jgi:hypothetical protein
MGGKILSCWNRNAGWSERQPLGLRLTMLLTLVLHLVKKSTYKYWCNFKMLLRRANFGVPVDPSVSTEVVKVCHSCFEGPLPKAMY